MKLHRSQSRIERRGFTLIEILVVSLVIALLSSIAVINIQQFVDNNKRKATLADLRSFATGLGFAHDDIGFYPKLTFLQESIRSPRLSVPSPTADPASEDPQIQRFHSAFQAYSLPVVNQFAAVTNWEGPYINFSVSRAGVAQGQGGIVNVQIPPDNAFPNGGQVVEWPADVWGSPYVLYLMKWELDSSGRYQRRFLGRSLNNEPRPDEFRDSADAVVAIVSYGKNRVPGLGDFPLDTLLQTRQASRLFTESTLSADPRPEFRMLGFLEFTTSMREVWEGQPVDQPGITDAGSDDLIIEF